MHKNALKTSASWAAVGSTVTALGLTLVVTVGAWLAPRPRLLSLGAEIALTVVGAVTLPVLLLVAMLPLSATVALAVYVPLATSRVAFLPVLATSCALGLAASVLQGHVAAAVGIFRSLEIEPTQHAAAPTAYLLILLTPLLRSRYRRALSKRVRRERGPPL